MRGQYEGYRSIGVAKDSATETYVALRLGIDNWRWSGALFFIRTGTGLPVMHTELRVVIKDAPRLSFHLDACKQPEPNQLVVELDPSTGTTVSVGAQRTDATTPEASVLDTEFAQEGGEGTTPYDVLSRAALTGDSKRFMRQDCVEEAMRMMPPLLHAPPRLHACAKGSWGAAAADDVGAGDAPRHEPWMAS